MLLTIFTGIPRAIYLALRSVVLVAYTLTVRPRARIACSCEVETREYESEDGPIKVTGPALAHEAYEFSRQAMARANAAYTHSSGVKSSVQTMQEPQTVEQWAGAVHTPAPITTPANGLPKAGTRMRDIRQGN